MSNAKGEQEAEYVTADPLHMLLVSWKTRYRKMLRALQCLNTSKSANGVPPKFLHECAKELTHPLPKRFRFIVRWSEFPSTWKRRRAICAP